MSQAASDRPFRYQGTMFLHRKDFRVRICGEGQTSKFRLRDLYIQRSPLRLEDFLFQDSLCKLELFQFFLPTEGIRRVQHHLEYTDATPGPDEPCVLPSVR